MDCSHDLNCDLVFHFLGWKKAMKASLTRKSFYKDAEFVAEYNSRFIARIKAAGGKIPYGTQFETILNGVHQEFYTDYVVCFARKPVATSRTRDP
jgi:hypothetical protein